MGSVELISSDMVLLAKSHNPSILSPEWLKKKCGIKDDPKQFVHTPDFSMFDSESVQIVVDQIRMQTVSKRTEDSSLKEIANIVTRYVKSLPQIPYAAVGMNHLWKWEGDPDERPRFNISSSGYDVPSKINGYEIEFGGILYGHATDHRVRILIEIQSPKKVTFNCNFHFDVLGRSHDFILGTIKKFKDRTQSSRNLVSKLLNLDKERK